MQVLKLKQAYDVPTGTVSIEKIIESDPDIIIIPNGMKPITLKKQLKAFTAAIKCLTLKAIKNKKVYILNYNYMFGYGYQSLAGFEDFAKARSF